MSVHSFPLLTQVLSLQQRDNSTSPSFQRHNRISYISDPVSHKTSRSLPYLFCFQKRGTGSLKASISAAGCKQWVKGAASQTSVAVLGPFTVGGGRLEREKVKMTEREPTFVMDVNTFSSTALGWALWATPGWMWRLWAQGLAIHLSKTSRRASNEQVNTQLTCVVCVAPREKKPTMLETKNKSWGDSFIYL